MSDRLDSTKDSTIVTPAVPAQASKPEPVDARSADATRVMVALPAADTGPGVPRPIPSPSPTDTPAYGQGYAPPPDARSDQFAVRGAPTPEPTEVAPAVADPFAATLAVEGLPLDAKPSEEPAALLGPMIAPRVDLADPQVLGTLAMEAIPAAVTSRAPLTPLDEQAQPTLAMEALPAGPGSAELMLARVRRPTTTEATQPPTTTTGPAEASALRRWVLRPLFGGVVPGVISFVGLFGLSLWLHRKSDYMGVEDSALEDTLTQMFESEIIGQQLGLLALYCAIGALTGLLAYAFTDVIRQLFHRPHRWRRHLLWTLYFIWFSHSWWLVYSIGQHPQLYAPQAAASTYLGVLFWLATDILPRAVVLGVGVLALLLLAAGAHVLLWRRVRAGPHWRRAPIWLAGAAAVLIGCTAWLTSAPTVAGVQSRRPNVLIIGVDSLRSDVLDRHPAVTPHIDAFARRGAVFPNTFTVLPRTLPAWTSILTGRYPHEHGVRHMFPEPKAGPLVEGTMPQRLGAIGYRTAVFSDFAGEVFSRGDLGFQDVHAPPFTLRSNVALGGLKVHIHLFPYLVEAARGGGFEELSAFERLGDPEWLTDAAIRWLADDDPRPFFMTVFYSAGHFPFASPAPFYERFAAPGYDGPSRFHKAQYGRRTEGAAEALERHHVRGLYHGAIAASDAAIGRLLSALDESGVLDHTIVVITADHGEAIYEHDLGIGHGDHLYGTEGLRVPLVMSWPGMSSRGARFEERASLLDIAPTVLGRLAVASDASGRDLGPAVDEGVPLEDRPMFAETGLVFFPPETHRLDGRRFEYADGLAAFRYTPGDYAIYLDPRLADTALIAKHRAVIAGDRKLLYIPTREGVRWELYDVASDPGDQVDLAASEPERVEALKELLYAWMLRDPDATRRGAYVVPKGGMSGPLERGFGP